MAFMMPLVKQNYSLYNTPGGANGTGTVPVAVPRRVRKNSDQSDRRPPGTANNRVVLRRNAKSEGASFSPSPPGYAEHHTGHGQHNGRNAQTQSSKPVEIRRGRFSMPQFLSPQSSFRKAPAKLRQTNSVPNPTKSPPAKPTFSPSSRSSLSSASSSDSIKDTNNGFQSRLLMRLRKTLGIGHKEPRPTSS